MPDLKNAFRGGPFQPYPLTRNHTDPGFGIEGGYDAGLAAALRYRNGDLARVVSGKVQKFSSITAADATNLCVADQSWTRNGAGELEPIPGYNDMPEKITRFHTNNRWVAMLSSAWSPSVLGTSRNLAYDSTDNVVKVQAGATSPAVKIIAIMPEVREIAVDGDTNVPVVVEFLPSASY